MKCKKVFLVETILSWTGHLDSGSRGRVNAAIAGWACWEATGHWECPIGTKATARNHADCEVSQQNEEPRLTLPIHTSTQHKYSPVGFINKAVISSLEDWLLLIHPSEKDCGFFRLGTRLLLQPQSCAPVLSVGRGVRSSMGWIQVSGKSRTTGVIFKLFSWKEWTRSLKQTFYHALSAVPIYSSCLSISPGTHEHTHALRCAHTLPPLLYLLMMNVYVLKKKLCIGFYCIPQKNPLDFQPLFPHLPLPPGQPQG